MTINEIRNATTPACDELGVRRLDVFGSHARGEESRDSNVDLLVEFEDPDRQLSERFFALLHHLEDTLHCKIDLLTPNSLKNPHFRHRVLAEKRTIYGG